MRQVEDYVYFVLLGDRLKSASYGFTGYTDKEGNYCSVDGKFDPRFGTSVPMKFRFNQAHRKLRYHKNQKDIIEFLSNHPECVGSVNGDYVKDDKGSVIQINTWFKKLDEEADAQVSVDAAVLRITAQNLVINKIAVDPVEMKNMAALLGYSGEGSTILHKLLEAAESDPQRFIDIWESPDRHVKSLFRKALASKHIYRKGVTYMFSDQVLGVDESQCMEALFKSEDLQEAVKRAVLSDEKEKVSKPRKTKE